MPLSNDYFCPCLAMNSFVRRIISFGFKSSAKPGIQDAYHRSGVILLLRFSAGDGEGSIVTPPKHKQRRLVDSPPGGADPVHRHNASAFVYVLEGSIVMQMKGGEK
jgi:quercetin dioxygenase-like cupin family protein